MSTAAAVALLGLALNAEAATYRLDQFPFTFMDATGVEAAFQTTQLGTFSGVDAVLTLLNQSTWSARLLGPSGPLTTLDHHNSSWSVSRAGGLSPDVELVIDAAAATFRLSTPSEFSGIALVLRSHDLTSAFQFRQENGPTDFTLVNFGFDAINDATYLAPYGSALTAPVDEPAPALLLSLGLAACAAVARRRIG